MKLNDSNLFRQQALINGEWLDANNGEVIDVTNPANGDKLGSVPKMGADETRAAIDAANRALPAWRALTAKERANILRNWFNLMMEHQDDLARLMTGNGIAINTFAFFGKPLNKRGCVADFAFRFG
ncbi:aldehyde dehydrogenase family protein [Escherichia coli]|uniref:aldehyde dehydrogenase family protein n=1 Tax=Escherichia coli TaxID=562 RepID=UPI003D81584F